MVSIQIDSKSRSLRTGFVNRCVAVHKVSKLVKCNILCHDFKKKGCKALIKTTHNLVRFEGFSIISFTLYRKAIVNKSVKGKHNTVVMMRTVSFEDVVYTVQEKHNFGK